MTIPHFFSRLAERLHDTGNIAYKQRNRTRPATGAANTALIVQSILENPAQSTRILARERGIILFQILYNYIRKVAYILSLNTEQ